MYEFKLPDVGEGIHEAEILQWLVKEGDVVDLDQPILEIQTDKAVVEIPSPVAGTIAKIRAKEGVMAHVGDVMVVIASTGQAPLSPGDQASHAETPPATATPPPSIGIAGPGVRILAAPAVRKKALAFGVDLARVPGSGSAGRVLLSDLLSFVEKPSPPPALPLKGKEGKSPSRSRSILNKTERDRLEEDEISAPLQSSLTQELTEMRPLQGLRRRIAERMEVAWRIPHVTTFEAMDASNLVALRQNLKPEAETRGVKLTYLPFIIKAVVQGLKENPDFNASLDMQNQRILYHHYYHIGIATAIPEGLVVPVLRHADQLSIIEIAAELTRLANLAHKRRLSVQELSGSTFTVTNFGSLGSWFGTPIINPPEAAILGVGRIEDKPTVVNGQVQVRPALPLALSFDHRLLDGAAAGKFSNRLKTLLSNPEILFLEMR